MNPTAPAMLPAIEVSVPDSDWSVASIKSIEMGCGVAFTASLRYQGKKVAVIENDGRGGVPIVIWTVRNVDTPRTAWATWVNGYQQLNGPAEDMPEPEYCAILSLMDNHEIAAALRKDSRKGIPVLAVGAHLREGGAYAVATRRTVSNPADIEALRLGRSEYDRYWDGERWIAL
ncbi:hypothetical protein [Prescottella agglutinans]|uniref:Uncharacterized protein n=1 Tax=Prescottella agglutinans TaxID=1644129 RepID=A0ABT6MHX9_9NOCA|nr:hypothetical protein [Prescottella agglutinans]MDH6283928.1 hypothetical protein [Prescottella agglutinans]